ncbi:MAG: hypothetical protein P8016_01755, partial [Sedimentisphaerales bacterium]
MLQYNWFEGVLMKVGTSLMSILFLLLIFALTSPGATPRQMENLNRGIVAVKQTNSVYVGWRMFGTDPNTITFN